MKKAKRQRKPLPIWLYFVIYGAVIAVCIALDQLTKHFMELHYENGGGDIPIIGDFLVMSFTRNTGATGSMFEDLSWRNWLFFVMTLVGLPVFFWLLWRARTRSVWGQVAFSFVIGGTLGNAVDRLFLAQNGFFTGSVRDFIRVKNFFGVFNIADSFLVVGVFMAVFSIVFFDPDSLLRVILRERKKNAEEAVEQQQTSEAEPAEEAPSNDDDAVNAANAQPIDQVDQTENPDEKD